MFSIEEWAKSVLSEKKDRELDEKIFTIRKVLVLCAIYTQIFLVIPSLSIYHIRHWGVNFFQTIPFFKNHPILGLLVSFGNMSLLILGGLSYLHLEWMFKDFVGNSKLHELITTLREMSGGNIIVYPKFMDFFFAQSLQNFEDRYTRLYDDQRRQLIKLKHLEQERGKIELQSERIKQEMHHLERQFSEALKSDVTEIDAADYERRFREAPTREKARAIIHEIRSKAEEREDITKKRTAKIKHLKNHLATLSDQKACKEAEHFSNLAEEIPDLKDKIELLKHAISLQKKFNARAQSESGDTDSDEMPAPSE
jgi:hypothetical protein